MASSFSFKETFTPIQSVQSLINLLGVKDTEKFEDLIRNGAETSYYIKPPIKKKNGGERIVYAPNKMLKSLLRKVNQKIFTQINYPDYLLVQFLTKKTHVITYYVQNSIARLRS
jgi:hypothetical protein